MGIDEFRDEDEDIVTIEQLNDIRNKSWSGDMKIIAAGLAVITVATYVAYWSMGAI